MTVRQRQLLLAYLGFYQGAIDGIWGERSMRACRAFQQAVGLSAEGCVDGVTDEALRRGVAFGLPQKEEASGDTGSFWQKITYFTREEFRCQCGGRYCDGFPAEPKEALVRIADQLRKNLGVPITVVSGLRCPQHNANVGGVANSQHMYGEAADIYAGGISQARVETELDAIGGVRYHYPIAGSSNVHFDIPVGSR